MNIVVKGVAYLTNRDHVLNVSVYGVKTEQRIKDC